MYHSLTREICITFDNVTFVRTHSALVINNKLYTGLVLTYLLVSKNTVGFITNKQHNAYIYVHAFLCKCTKQFPIDHTIKTIQLYMYKNMIEGIGGNLVKTILKT